MLEGGVTRPELRSSEPYGESDGDRSTVATALPHGDAAIVGS